MRRLYLIPFPMKQVTVHIPESHFSFFMKLLRSLNFVQVVDPTTLEDTLSLDQQQTWLNIKKGFEELKDAEQNKKKLRPVEALLQEQNK